MVQHLHLEALVELAHRLESPSAAVRRKAARTVERNAYVRDAIGLVTVHMIESAVEQGEYNGDATQLPEFRVVAHIGSRLREMQEDPDAKVRDGARRALTKLDGADGTDVAGRSWWRRWLGR